MLHSKGAYIEFKTKAKCDPEKVETLTEGYTTVHSHISSARTDLDVCRCMMHDIKK